MPVRTDFTHEERVANGRKGAAKANQTKKEKAKMKDQLKIMMQLLMVDPKKKKPKKLSSIKSLEEMNPAAGYNGTVQEMLLLKQLQLALKGNTKAFEMIMSLIGEAPAPPKAEKETENELDTSMQENQQEIISLLKGRKVEGFNDANASNTDDDTE